MYKHVINLKQQTVTVNQQTEIGRVSRLSNPQT